MAPRSLYIAIPLLAGLLAAQGRSQAARSTGQSTITDNSGAISGVIVDGVTKQPLAGAVAALGAFGRGPLVQTSRQVTDEKGRFVFTNLAAFGSYFISASLPGYDDGAYALAPGSYTPGSIAIAAGQWFRDANVSLWRHGSISGVVMDSRGEPIVGAYVRALPELIVAGVTQLAAGVMTTTDDRGEYRLPGLAPGAYRVQLASVQYTVPATTSTAGLAGLTEEGAANAERTGRAVVPMPALEIDGASRRVLSRFPVPPATADGRPTVYPVLFYPNARTPAEASTITIGRGDNKTAVDFRIDAVPGLRVTGRVDGPPDAVAGIPVRLFPRGAEAIGHGGEAATAVAAPDGTFTFLNVPAGDYVLTAQRLESGFTRIPPFASAAAIPATPGVGWTGGTMLAIGSGPSGTYIETHTSSGSQMWSGLTRVSVGATDVSGVSVVLRGAGRISGRVAYEMATPADQPASPVGLSITAEPANGLATLGLPRTRLDNQAMSGPFTIEGLLAGEYLLRPQAPTGWTLKSVIWNGRDFTHTPFDATSGQDVADVRVTLTNATTLLTGAVRTPQGMSAANAAVIAFPAERDQWSRYGLVPIRIRATHVSTEGGFRFTSLPAGDYLLIAVDDARVNAWQDPKFLESAAAQATRVTLRWGDTIAQDLRMEAVR